MVDAQKIFAKCLNKWLTKENELAIHSSPLAWEIPWAEEPGRLQSTWLQRVRHD